MTQNTQDPHWTEVDRQLRRIACRRSELDAKELQWILVAKRMELHLQFGFPSMETYLEHAIGYERRTAKDRLRVATNIAGLPSMLDALASGRLSFSAVRELVRVASPETAEVWIETAAGRTIREVEAMVSGRKRGDEPTSRTRERRRVVRYELGPETYALFMRAQQKMRRAAEQPLDDEAIIAAISRAILAMELPAAMHDLASDSTPAAAPYVTNDSAPDAKPVTSSDTAPDVTVAVEGEPIVGAPSASNGTPENAASPGSRTPADPRRDGFDRWSEDEPVLESGRDDSTTLAPGHDQRASQTSDASPHAGRAHVGPCVPCLLDGTTKGLDISSAMGPRHSEPPTAGGIVTKRRVRRVIRASSTAAGSPSGSKQRAPAATPTAHPPAVRTVRRSRRR